MDPLDEPIKFLVSRRSLVELHHLHGPESLRLVTDAFCDELHRIIGGLQMTGHYETISKACTDRLFKAAQVEKERS